jgi:hypothetical protein
MMSFNGRQVVGFGLDDPPSCPVCPALPSGSSAVALLSGDWHALPAVVGYTALRGALIGAGILAVGERTHVLRNAVVGTLAIETFVLAWAAWKKLQKEAS